jgi:hypothetical protein
MRGALIGAGDWGLYAASLVVNDLAHVVGQLAVM